MLTINRKKADLWVHNMQGPLGKTSISSPPAAHVRTVRKMSTDHLALNIDSDSDPLISAHEADDKGSTPCP